MRSDVAFMSHGTKSVGWLYRPETSGVSSCVVMAHGFSAVREQQLDAYAERFARDIATMLFGREPHRIPAAGPPGTLAVMATADAVAGIARVTPPGSTWRNDVCARIVLSVAMYRPGNDAGRIPCSILYTIAEQDRLTPARFAHDAVRRACRAEVNAYPCGHFDVYVPPLWETVVADQTDFLVRHLKPEVAVPAKRPTSA